MQQIPASLAAKALNVSLKSVHLWFAAGKLDGEQTVSGRLWVTAGSCRALIRERRGPNSLAEQDFERILTRETLPTSPFPKDRPETATGPKKAALSSA